MLARGRAIPREGMPITAEGAEVGRITSGGYSYHFGHDIAMALIHPDKAELGTKLAVNVHNGMREAIIVEDSPYDPTNARARL